jgi:p-aminobenzoyl-glutamate transporter AbgT
MLGTRGKARILLPLTVLFLVVGGGMLHCAHSGSMCGFADHNDIKHHQITPPGCFMVVLVLALMFPVVSISYGSLAREMKNDLQVGHPTLLFRPPQLSL